MQAQTLTGLHRDGALLSAEGEPMFLLQVQTATSWSDAVRTAVADALALLLGGIPRVIAFLLILLIGWFIASLLEKVIDRVLETVKFDDMATRSGLQGFIRSTGANADASSFVAMIVKWFVRLIALIAAFDALGVPQVSAILQTFVLWLPNLLVAIIILVITGLLANAASGLVRGATAQADLGNPNLLASITRVAIWVFGIVVAVNQIGIATTLVNTLFMGFVGALALALGLAFGLGGRETAGRAVENWYQRSQAAAPKLREAAQTMQQQGSTTVPSAGLDPNDTSTPGSTTPRVRPSS